jgi:hypothetical protein
MKSLSKAIDTFCKLDLLVVDVSFWIIIKQSSLRYKDRLRDFQSDNLQYFNKNGSINSFKIKIKD